MWFSSAARGAPSLDLPAVVVSADGKGLDKDGPADAAADNDITYEKMLKKGLITQESNRILLESDPLPGSPLVYRSSLDDATKTKIREIILNAHNKIKVTGYGELLRYEPATPKDYQLIHDMIEKMALTRKQMLK